MITATQKLGIIISVIILGLVLVLIEAGLALALYSLTQNLILTEVSIGVELIVLVLALYVFYAKTNKSFIAMNTKMST